MRVGSGTIAMLVMAQLQVALGQESDRAYYCVVEASGGIHYNQVTKKWEGTGFYDPAGWFYKFVLRVKANEQVITYSATNMPEQCISNNARSVYDLVISCSAGWMEYTFDFSTNRFLAVYPLGYTNGVNNNSNTPFIAGGTCTKIN
jgi:hypothetical protein